MSARRPASRPSVSTLVAVIHVMSRVARASAVTIASGHPGALAVFNCVSLVLVALVAYFVAPFGIDMVAVAMAGLEVMFMLIAQYVVLWRTVGVPLRDTFRDPAPAIICTAIMIAVVAPIASLLGDHLPALLNVAVCGLLGLLVYGAAVNRLSPSGWKTLCSLARVLAPARRIRAVRRRLAPSSVVSVAGREG